MGFLSVALLDGTIGIARTDIAGLPADVDRTEGVCSTKFRPNAGDGDLVALADEIEWLLLILLA